MTVRDELNWHGARGRSHLFLALFWPVDARGFICSEQPTAEPGRRAEMTHPLVIPKNDRPLDIPLGSKSMLDRTELERIEGDGVGIL